MADATDEISDEELEEQIKMLEKLQLDLAAAAEAMERGEIDKAQLLFSNIKTPEAFDGALGLIGALKAMGEALGIEGGGVELQYVGLKCDHEGCTAVMKHEPGNTPGDMRAEGDHEGWLVQYEGGGLDYCPKHRVLYEGETDDTAGVPG